MAEKDKQNEVQVEAEIEVTEPNKEALFKKAKELLKEKSTFNDLDAEQLQEAPSGGAGTNLGKKFTTPRAPGSQNSQESAAKRPGGEPGATDRSTPLTERAGELARGEGAKAPASPSESAGDISGTPGEEAAPKPRFPEAMAGAGNLGQQLQRGERAKEPGEGEKTDEPGKEEGQEGGEKEKEGAAKEGRGKESQEPSAGREAGPEVGGGGGGAPPKDPEQQWDDQLNKIKVKQQQEAISAAGAAEAEKKKKKDEEEKKKKKRDAKFLRRAALFLIANPAVVFFGLVIGVVIMVYMYMMIEYPRLTKAANYVGFMPWMVKQMLKK